jgi:hypothetical protein
VQREVGALAADFLLVVGVDPLALLDPFQDALGLRRQMEADMPHPRHGGTADLDADTGIDALLAIERQASAYLETPASTR